MKLSPFVVESTEGGGYRAQSTLAGTRVRTDLKDVASSISVVTAGSGDSISWGVVLHTPKLLCEKLPRGTDIALTYRYGKNTRVENRYGVDASVLPNAVGRTRGDGIVINILNDKVRLKATIYDTKVSGANLSSVTTEVSTLGSNTY